MVNGLVDFHATSGDLGFQKYDAGFQFIHRKWIEILPRELVGGVIQPFGERIFGFHRTNVDRGVSHVNKSNRLTRRCGVRCLIFQNG
jgi:hypothetical protein